jgi:glutamate racemase
MSAAAGTYEEATIRYTKPIFEVITPGSQAACAASASGKIGVIATLGTVNSGVYPRTLSTLGAQSVYQQACPAFVPLVERGIDSGSEVNAAVTEYLTPLCAVGVDTLIMGCTHYPYLRTAISNFLGTKVRLIDPGAYVAQNVARYFAARSSALRPNTDARRPHFYSSGDPESLRREGERLLGIPLLSVEHVEVPDDASSGS